MKETDILKQLKDFRDIEPDEKWYHVNRSILLNIIEKDSVNRKKTFKLKTVVYSFFVFSRNIMPNWKVALSSFMAVAMVGGTVFGAGASLPGDNLYSVKIGMEKAELAFAADDLKATNLRLKHIDKRLEELKKMTEEGKSQANIDVLARNIEENVNGVQAKLTTLASKDNVKPEELVQLVKLVDEKTISASKALNEVNKDNKVVTDIVKSTNDLGQKALEMIIEKGSDAEKNTVANSLNTKIQLQENRLNVTTDKIEEVKNIVSPVVKDGVKAETSTSSSQTMEFNMDQIKKIDPSQIAECLKSSRDLIEKKDYSNALTELKKAQFYLDLSEKAFDNVLKEGYRKDIENIEQNIKEVENKDNLKK